MLTRYRKRRPINGTIVSISISDLLTQGRGERDAQVSAIKQRLQELNTQLKASFPVYVVFTKCDLIPGFTEFFDDLGREERGQVWGMTFPFSGSADATAINNFNEEFDALVDRANKRVVSRMEQERDPERRARIFSFTQQFGSAKQLMDEFLREVFQGNRYTDDTLLRGVYFTSGTQEGTPIDRIMGSLSRNLGINPQMMRSQGAVGKSYFVTRLFQDLIFPEAELAGSNRKLEVQRFWLQRIAYASAIVITAVAVLAWTTSYTRNQVYVNTASDAVESYQQVSTQADVRADFDTALQPLNAARGVMDVYSPFRDDVPLLMGMGLYQGDRIDEAGTQAYQRELQRLFIPPLKARLESQIQLGDSNPDLQYQALRTYLMLGKQEHLDAAHVSAWMGLIWSSDFAGDAEAQHQLQGHLGSMLTLGFQPIEFNAPVVQAARSNLKLTSRGELLYGMIKRDYFADDKQALPLPELYGSFRYQGV